MKAFIAYRHTGEKFEDLEKLLTAVRNSLKEAGIESYCTFFDESEFQNKKLGASKIMEHAFSIIDNSDLLFVVQTSESKSEGMLIEVGYCIAKKIPIVVAVKSGIKNSYLPEISDKVINWNSEKDLARKIKEFNFKKA